MKISGRVLIYIIGFTVLTRVMNISETIELDGIVNLLNNVAEYYCESRCFLM